MWRNVAQWNKTEHEFGKEVRGTEEVNYNRVKGLCNETR